MEENVLLTAPDYFFDLATQDVLSPPAETL